MRIAIIGAGPAGMTAALEAAKTKAQVLLLDANPSPGRKLAVTGSGRCNLSNKHANPDKYHTSDPEPLIKILNQFGNRQLTTWLEGMGIYTTTTEDGWVYPASFSAQNVVDIFQEQLLARGVVIHPHTLITEIHPEGSQFILSTQDKTHHFTADKVVVATGGPAAPQLGAREDIYPVLQRLGHTILPVKPALAPILTDPRQFHKLQGVRLDAGITLVVDGREVDQTIGNIIFTSWGINGPGVMDLSHLVHQYDQQNLELSIDFLPHQPERLEKMIQKKENSQIALSVLLKSFFPAKLAQYLLDQCGISLEKTSEQITDLDRTRLHQAIHQQGVKIMGVKGFKDCQLSTGGVPLKEIDAETMHSTIVPGLSLAGEVLDVIGPCGGYNLQWAFSSGFIAGRRILK
jgi:predicted Rossmann fold flavoprotein